MLSNVNRRLASGERGFTLIELLVVMIIIAILLAIAIPMFLGQRQRALATEAKSNSRSVLTTIQSCLTSGASCFTEANITAEEPSLAVPVKDVGAVPCGITTITDKESCVVTAEGTLLGGTLTCPVVPTATVPTSDSNYCVNAMTKYEKGIRVNFVYNPLSGAKTCGAVARGGATAVTPTGDALAFYNKLCPAGTW